MRIGDHIEGIGTVRSIDESGPFGPIATCEHKDGLIGVTRLPGAIGSSRSARGVLSESQGLADDLAAAAHAHGVPIARRLDFRYSHDSAWLCLRQLEGYTLEAKPVSPTTIDEMSWLRPVSEALDFCHQRGIAHGDVRPFNIWLSQSASATLMDVGMTAALIEVLKRLTGSDILGTLPFRAPEHIGGGASGAGDIYSLGVCIYQQSCGVLPFAGGNLLHTIRTRAIPGHSRLSPALYAVLESATAKKPEGRPGSATDLVSLARNCLDTSESSDASNPAETVTEVENRPTETAPEASSLGRFLTRPLMPAALAILLITISVSCMFGMGLAVSHAERAEKRRETLLAESHAESISLRRKLRELSDHAPLLAQVSGESEIFETATSAVGDFEAAALVEASRSELLRKGEVARESVSLLTEMVEQVLSTGVRIRCSTPGATVAISGQADVPFPVEQVLSPGRYPVIASAPGYRPKWAEVDVAEGAMTELDLGALELGRREGRLKPGPDQKLVLDLGSNDGLRLGTAIRVRIESQPIRGPGGNILGYDEIEAEVISVEPDTSVALPLTPLTGRSLSTEPYEVIRP